MAGLVGGGLVAPGTLEGDSGRLLATFLGIVSASLLPTVSLIVGNMTASGRSVLALNKLKDELDAAMDALFLLLGGVGVVIASLFTLELPPPAILTRLPYLTSELLPRLGQAIVVTMSALIVLRAGQVPAILRRTLAIRHEISVDEARRKLGESAPTSAETRALFARDPNFGKVVKMDDLHGANK